MPGDYEVKRPGSSDVEKHCGSRGLYYELPDGSHIDLVSRPCWCANCCNVTNGEWIESLDDLGRRLDELSDPNSKLCQDYERSEKTFRIPGAPRFGFREKAVKKTADRLRWRRLRTASPKCTRCGSTSIYFPSEDDDGAVLIDGKPIAWIQCVGMCSTQFNEWYYTVEGDRIPRDTKPKYWQIPKNAD